MRLSRLCTLNFCYENFGLDFITTTLIGVGSGVKRPLYWALPNLPT
jgi:hypothetical protein